MNKFLGKFIDRVFEKVKRKNHSDSNFYVYSQCDLYRNG